MIRNYFVLLGAFALMAGLGTIGCNKSDSGDSGSSGGGAKISGAEREARDAALAEVQKRWLKGPDGWSTARTIGSAYAPDHVIRQLRELAVDNVDKEELTDSDKLNGIEWAGHVTFKQAPCREIGDPGVFLDGISNASIMRQPHQWTQWVDFQPDSIRMLKIKGKWQAHEDTWLLRGTLPTPADFAKAGAK